MNIRGSILRVFEVRAKPGKADDLKRSLSGTSVAVVKGRPGNQGYLFGENVHSDGNDLVFISVWKDMESVRSVFGGGWEVPFLPEGYEESIESCSVRHIEVEGLVTIQADS